MVTTIIHTLNLLIGILSLIILSLVAHTVILTDSLPSYPSSIDGTSRAILFWPGCGGIVDMLLFMILWYLAPSNPVRQSRAQHVCGHTY
jgi:uncharacterized BrkB/YihY/UPF0761 family membrane protein